MYKATVNVHAMCMHVRASVSFDINSAHTYIYRNRIFSSKFSLNPNNNESRRIENVSTVKLRQSPKFHCL